MAALFLLNAGARIAPGYEAYRRDAGSRRGMSASALVYNHSSDSQE
jgi:hypothetical protein